MTVFTEKVVQIILAIPPGKVMTYGQIARLAGNARGARQVVRILNSMTEKYNMPWHRVINSKGTISLKSQEGYDLQKALLAAEGVDFGVRDTIDLSEFAVNDLNELFEQ